MLGNSAVIFVFDSDDSTSGAQVTRTIASFAEDHGVTVAREVPDLRDPDGRRHLYMTAGDDPSDASEWLNEGYPAFSSNLATDVHPIADIGQRDPRGHYYVFGPPETADALVAEFSGLGLRADVSHPLSYEELATTYTNSVMYWSFWVITLAAVTLTGASVLLSARTYGILRLQGFSLMHLLVRDLRQLLVPWAVTLGAVTAVALTFLGFYNGFAWLSLFATLAAALAGLLILLVVSAHVAVIALTFKVDVLQAVKGALPARTASVGVYLVRIPALLLALSVATDIAAVGRDMETRQENRAAYAEAGDAVTIRLNGGLSGEKERVVEEIGPWLRRADSNGEVILAGRRDLQNLAPGSHLPPGEVLVVNETFLTEQPVLDPAGQRYMPADGKGKAAKGDRVRLIVPESLRGHEAALTKAVAGVLASEFDPRTQLEALPAKGGQSVFTYNPGNQVYNAAHSQKEDRSLVQDPVLVVVPNGSHFVSDDGYTAFAAQEGVVFPDPDVVVSAIQGKRLGVYVVALRPVAENSALKMREVVTEFRVQLFNLALTVTVLLIAGLGICVIYARKNAQSIFAQHINGWRYVATHRFILGVEAAIAFLLATRVPFETWMRNKDLERIAASGAPLPRPLVELTGLDLGIIAGLVAVEFGAVLLALAVFHRRIIREGATEA
ncbi:hypothetical protein QNO09_12040 [Streptomyces sp. 378]|uniref:hypothetical protein n=1 Tax=Streptomyces sp. 378 TaxID=3049412 RepID=UPI0024C25B90|nr:hypothetical protein [Streptomyces sp. 378]MDK1344023.1 hypothetical protein [Streptomyces sp. 378]